jgi:hypothetical protein
MVFGWRYTTQRFVGSEKTPFKKYISYSFSFWGNIRRYYEASPLEIKHKLLGSIFPEKLIYADKSFRTTHLNTVLASLLQCANELQKPKSEKVGRIADKSSMAPPAGLLLNQIVADLQAVAELP